MFAKLFKPKWQVGKTEERLAAIEKLDPRQQKDMSALQTIAGTDAEIRVRQAAVRRLDDREVLQTLLKTAQDDELREGIQRQLINLSVEADLESMDESQLLEVALQHRQTRLRLLAAEKIHTAGLLELLARESRDKAVLRHVRGELKKVREEQAQREARVQEIDAVIEALAGLAGRSEVDQFFMAKYDKAEAQWREVEAEASAEQRQRYAEAVAACAAEVNAIRQAAEAERQQQAAARAQEQLVEELEQQAAQLHQRAASAEQIQQQLDRMADEWQQSESAHKPGQALARRYAAARGELDAYCITLDQLKRREIELRESIREIDLFSADKPAEIEAMRERLAPLRKSIQWPQGVAAPALLQQWEQACDKLDLLQRELDQQAEDAVRALARKRRQLDVHIEKGELKVANRIHGQIHHLLEKLWGRELERQQQRLQPLEEALQKLRDWHGFSTEPKKQELCERMEKLAAIEMDALDKAEAIKALQEEWREQTSVNIIEDDPLWQRFQEAGHKAYEPCAEYFQKQAEIKQLNLQKRRELAQQLENFINAVDWAAPDWKKVQKALRSARDEWKQYDPVRFPDAKPVHDHFFALVDQINERLKTYWQSNLEAKQDLVARAEALAELEDLPQAIEKAVFLQKQWREVGQTFRSREQKVWKAFRAACDAVFSRRDAERQQERAASDERIAEADRLIAEMGQLATLGDEVLARSGEQAEALQAAFAEVELPEKLVRPLQGKFDEARRRYEQQVEGIALRKRAAALDQLAQCAAICDQAEVAVLEGASPEAQALSADWQAAFAPLEGDDQAIQQRFDQVLAVINGAEFTGLESNLELLERLAIEVEVLMDVATPEEFRGERMAYQLDKLSDGMGGSRDSSERQAELVALRRRWYLTGAVPAQQRLRLQQRLAAVLQAN